MYFQATIHIFFKNSMLDPQAVAIQNAIKTMQDNSVESLKMGKYFEIKIKASSKQQATEKIEYYCNELLSNPVIHQYKYTIQESSHEQQ